VTFCVDVDSGGPDDRAPHDRTGDRVVQLLDRIHASRLAFVRALLIEAGVGRAEAARRTLVAYAMVAGVHVLASTGHGLI
jgi:hypothetical protein